MVNVYQDERSQQIYNVIDKGRIMQQAFRGMTLLDYAVNASLVLSYVAMRKDDKTGLVTFDEHFDTFVPASKQPDICRHCSKIFIASRLLLAKRISPLFVFI